MDESLCTAIKVGVLLAVQYHQAGITPEHHHGAAHLFEVMRHAKESTSDLAPEIKLSVILAALLHDVDDRKLFPRQADPRQAHHTNLERILALAVESRVQRVCVSELVALTSTAGYLERSELGEDDVADWMFVVRDAERLTQLGRMGARRCREYAARIGLPVSVRTTPMPRTLAELDDLLARPQSRNRFQVYKATRRSASELDHYLDKLFWLRPCSSLEYFVHEYAVAQAELKQCFLERVAELQQ
jgi:uncharacterized protein